MMTDPPPWGADPEASGVAVWSRGLLSARLLEVAAAGGLTALLLVLFWLKPRPDFWVAVTRPFFWIKAFYPLLLASVALLGASAAARPGASLRGVLIPGAAVLALIVVAVALELPNLDSHRLAHVFDFGGALSCVAYASLLALPMLLAAGFGLRGFQLERPALTGLFVGLLCGAVAASAYSVHCPDATFLYVALWYTLGVTVCGAVGAAGLKLISRRPQPDAPLSDLTTE